MGALTETGPGITEFSGGNRIFFAKITGAATGTVTIGEFTGVRSVQVSLAGDSTADCCGYSTSVSTNVVTCKGIEGDGTVATQNYVDFWLTVIGY